jgi:hypothetical protein
MHAVSERGDDLQSRLGGWFNMKKLAKSAPKIAGAMSWAIVGMIRHNIASEY